MKREVGGRFWHTLQKLTLFRHGSLNWSAFDDTTTKEGKNAPNRLKVKKLIRDHKIHHLHIMKVKTWQDWMLCCTNELLGTTTKNCTPSIAFGVQGCLKTYLPVVSLGKSSSPFFVVRICIRYKTRTVGNNKPQAKKARLDKCDRVMKKRNLQQGTWLDC